MGIMDTLFGKFVHCPQVAYFSSNDSKRFEISKTLQISGKRHVVYWQIRNYAKCKRQ